MEKSLIIGLGGTGSRVVNNLAKMMSEKGISINDSNLCCAVFDTNRNDVGDIIRSNTGIETIQTSRAQKIADYIEDYSHLRITDWCPESPEFLEESMIDGASEVRVKSRIAFLDCVSTDLINRFEAMLNDVIDSHDNSKIRVMIISSVSGGTGSGMFIQAALWIRKKLSRSQISIRGIFLLPDVFINTVDDIKENKRTQVRHYSNAYAAIRELNALSKIKKSGSIKLEDKITIGDLFDSALDANTGVPIYDKAYLIDYQDANGVALDSLSEYEEMVAQFVYMQMHQAMKDDIYSEEDNMFLATHESKEPLFCSCGAAKAVYPSASVRRYCVLRASEEALSQNWKKIDNEFQALKEKREIEESEGIFRDDVLDFPTEYVRIFEQKTSTERKNAGKDRFFFSIANDVKNGKTKTSDVDRLIVQRTDKVDDFIELIKKEKVDKAIAKYGYVDNFTINEESFVDEDHSKEDLIEIARTSDIDFEVTLNEFDKNVKRYAEELVGDIIPYSMGDINRNNKCSVYSLFVKNNPGEEDGFVHPVAARYMLYKLLAKLRLEQVDCDNLRTTGLNGGDPADFFNNPKTKDVEDNIEESLESKKWYQNKESFIDGVEGRYAQFINNKVVLCQKYEMARLSKELFMLMIPRIESLIKEMTVFFNTINDIIADLKVELALNLKETNDSTGKTLYICGTEEHKEKLFASLDLGLGKNSEVNKSAIDTIYGSFCAKERPKDSNNSDYVDIDIKTLFKSELAKAYGEVVDDINNVGKIDLNIYDAVCREYDFDDGSGKKRIGKVNMDDGSIEVEDNTQEYDKLFASRVKTVFRKAAPFLYHEKEPTQDKQGATTMRTKTFWGFHPSVTEVCPGIGRILGINEKNQQDDRYLKSELYCYRADYGIEAKYIPNFNELKGGKYYECYESTIDKMIGALAEAGNEHALVSSPHIDKRWHKILPYVSPDKQKDTEIEFYHTLWLAIAYGIIHIGKDGLVYINRLSISDLGSRIETDSPLIYNDKKLTKTDVAAIIELLKQDQEFITLDKERVESEFKQELSDVNTYIGTRVLQGLVTKNEDLNPINFVCRYSESSDTNKAVVGNLVGGLEKIAQELAENYDSNRGRDAIESAKFRICKTIYDSSTRKKGKSEAFATWERVFEQLK